MAVFNNWGVVALGWYFVVRSQELRGGQARGFQICGQEIVMWRGSDGRVRAADAYCPHMGTHLGIGKVIGNNLRCFFHHWQFDSEGECVEIPCQKEIPRAAKVKIYSVEERFDMIWIYPSAIAPPLTESFDKDLAEELSESRAASNRSEERRWSTSFGKAYERRCHHHVTMINGLDPQHLKTVHNLDIEMKVEIRESLNHSMDIELSGEIGGASWKERLARKILGSRYTYGIKYDHGNNGFLTLMRDASLFGRWRLPALHMIFAYRPLEHGKVLVQPIYVTRCRVGFLGKMLSAALIFLTKRAFFALQGEDGLVYENMRFFPANLLPMDRPVAKYIQYVNRLPTSEWSLHGNGNESRGS